MWSGGPYGKLGKQNREIRPICKGQNLTGYFMVADGTLLSMLPDGSGKTTVPIPSDGHGCTFARSLLACQVGTHLNIYDMQFREVASLGPLTMPYGLWAPSNGSNDAGLLYIDGIRPGPYHVNYWSAAHQSVRLGPDVDYDLDCELNGNCFGFVWGTELPVWSPDGKTAYFSLPDATNKNRRVLGWVDVTTPGTTGTFNPLTEKIWTVSPISSVAPDGKSVAFASFSENPNEGQVQLFVLRLAGGKPMQVTHVAKGHIVGPPHWQ